MNSIQTARLLVKHAQVVLFRNLDYGMNPLMHMDDYKSIADYLKKKRKKNPKRKT